MAILTVIIGLPGAGKTEYARHIYRELQFVKHDYMAHAQSQHIEASIHHDELFARLGRDEHCVINDIAFTQETWQEQIRRVIATNAPATTIEWIVFRSDPPQSVCNVARRLYERHHLDLARFGMRLKDYIDRIIELTPGFTIPAGARVIDTWRPSA